MNLSDSKVKKTSSNYFFKIVIGFLILNFGLFFYLFAIRGSEVELDANKFFNNYIGLIFIGSIVITIIALLKGKSFQSPYLKILMYLLLILITFMNGCSAVVSTWSLDDSCRTCEPGF